MRKAPAQDGENFFFDLFYSSGRRATRAPLLAYDHSEGASLQMGRGGEPPFCSHACWKKVFKHPFCSNTSIRVSFSVLSLGWMVLTWGGESKKRGGGRANITQTHPLAYQP